MARTSWDIIVGRDLTLFEDAVRYLTKHPRKSACQIARALRVKAASLSGTLHRATQEGKLVRTKDGGPRGGYVYEVIG